MTAPLVILYSSERWIAVDKPAGMIVHRSAWCRDGEPVLQRLRDQIGARVYPVHRLDRATSGVLLFARTPEAAHHGSTSFAAHRIDKRYLAIVRGWPDAHTVVDAPLGDDAGVLHDAVTELTRRATVELPIAVGRYATARYALVEARPQSGRTHQIRRHCAHLRHPIVGDVNYGDGRHNRMWKEVLERPGMMLRAVALRWTDTDGREVEVVADDRLALPDPSPLAGR
jgi:tRNA pseudouridine65 synthase